MSSGIFYRNVRARDNLDLFVLSAASSLLLVRFYLYLAGYPQIGSGGLHIAHMLWGGVLMLTALAINATFLGARALRVAAIVGGAGFGIFIDELGKFITRDNNYFYQPTVGIIYAIFVILYLTFNFLSRKQVLTSREYQLNALAQLEEAVVHDMDPTEKARVTELLARADQQDPLTIQLQTVLAQVRPTRRTKTNRLTRGVRWLDRQYERFWHQRNSHTWVRAIFLAEVLVLVSSVVFITYNNIDTLLDFFGDHISWSSKMAVGQLCSSIVAAALIAWGTIILPKSRMRAYEQFRRATLVNIYLTQFFIFGRQQFAALPGFFLNLLLLGAISYAIRQEVRLKSKKRSGGAS